MPQDYPEALKWYRLSAAQGLADSPYNLGVMYATGQGVPQDFVEAYAWFSVAVVGGDAIAVGNRDLAASKLTPEQLSQGRKKATEVFKKIGSGK